MTDLVKIKIDLSLGTVEVEAPIGAVDSVFDRLESFLPRLTESKAQIAVRDLPVASTSEKVKTEEVETKEEIETDKKKERKSSGKPELFKQVDLNLSEEQREEFRNFYKGKNGKNQNDHVLVVMFWLLNNLDKESLNKEEIFTGLRTVGERIPKRLSSVLSNLGIEGKVVKINGKFSLHHVGEDYVDRDLPKKKSKE